MSVCRNSESSSRWADGAAQGGEVEVAVGCRVRAVDGQRGDREERPVGVEVVGHGAIVAGHPGLVGTRAVGGHV